MKRKRFSEEQIIGILNEAAAGATAVEVCRRHGISETTCYRWKAKFGGLAMSEAKRLRQLEAENSRLKRLLAEAHLDNAALKDLLAKQVTPAARRRALRHLVEAHRCSERRACELVGLARSVARYRSRRRDDAELRARLCALAGQHRRFGYRRLHALLRREGLVIKRKRTYRLYKADDLAVRRRPSAPPAGARASALGRARAAQPALVDGLRERRVVDRTALSLPVPRRRRHPRKPGTPGRLRDRRGEGRAPCSTSSPAATACRRRSLWTTVRSSPAAHSSPGRPEPGCGCASSSPASRSKTRFVESFIGRFRDECLNQHWFGSLAEAARIIEAWRQHDNRERPHSALGYEAPEWLRAPARCAWTR